MPPLVPAPSSLVENLLRSLFKFTSSFVVQLLLFGHGGGAVGLPILLLAPGWELSTGSCCVHLLPTGGGVGLLGHSALQSLIG
jgi:hypothetical protein